MKLPVLFVFLFAAVLCRAGDSTEVKKTWHFSGYLKAMYSHTTDRRFSDHVSGYLLHNRVNVSWEPSPHLKAAVELRNRLLWGEAVRRIPGYAQLLRNRNEGVNLQRAWWDGSAHVLHTNVERCNMAYQRERWSARIGRQRINWGITTTWNPNDLFNAFNFLDFDYEERPGVDGARLQYRTGRQAHVEMAYALTAARGGHVAAVNYAFNQWGYDWQWIAGWYKDQVTLGAGWAGNIGDMGFKGEGQYFFPGSTDTSHFNFSAECDYMFKSSWYLKGGFLFNRNGAHRPFESPDEVNLNIAPENLMPTQWNLLAQVSREISPLSSASLGIVYAPGARFLILLPSVRYNLATNLDADLVWQAFRLETPTGTEVNHLGFLRLKWSM